MPTKNCKGQCRGCDTGTNMANTDILCNSVNNFDRQSQATTGQSSAKPHSSSLYSLRRKLQLMACHVSRKLWKKRIFLCKEVKIFILNPGEMVQGSNMTPILKGGENFVVRGRLTQFCHRKKCTDVSHKIV